MMPILIMTIDRLWDMKFKQLISIWVVTEELQLDIVTMRKKLFEVQRNWNSRNVFIAL